MRRVGQAAESRPHRFARAPALTLAFAVVVLAVLAYYPFNWDPPHIVRNVVTRTKEGYLQFGEWNSARSAGTPGWLATAQTAGHLNIDLEARPQFPQRNAPASIMMLARDYWHTSFAIAQSDSDLMLWLHRMGSTDNGDPPYTVPDVFRPNHWSRVGVQIAGRRLVVTVDRKVRLAETLPSNPLNTWHGGRIALGNEVHGGKGWIGDIRHAGVTTPGSSIDYVRSAALVVPRSYFYLPDHIAPFPPPTTRERLILVLHLLSFVVVGFLVVWIRRPALGVLPATIMAFSLAVVLALGKFFFHGRHTSLADLGTQLLGALIGAMIGHRALRDVEQGRSPSSDGSTSLAARAN